MKQYLFIVTVITAVLYLLCSFYWMDFNPVHWNYDGRFTLTALWLSCIVLTTLIFGVEGMFDKKKTP